MHSRKSREKHTISETLFEEFCRENLIPCWRIPRDQGKTADYRIEVGGHDVIAEVKEFTPNDEDEQAAGDFRKDGFASWGCAKIGSRVRNKIDKGKRQLARLAEGKCPAVLVLYDARPTPTDYFNGMPPRYEVLVAMYGWETIPLDVPGAWGKPVQFGKHRFGKGKKFRENTHAYISAIGLLKRTNPCEPVHLDLYLNVFADFQLPEELVSREAVTVYSLADGEGNEFRGWERVVPAG